MASQQVWNSLFDNESIFLVDMKYTTWVYPSMMFLLVLSVAINCTKNDANTPVTVTDNDGNIYNTVTICTQVWMVENLKTTKYRNGDPIVNGTTNSGWKTHTNGAYCDYNNNPDKSNDYGRLYNWYAVNTENLCPEGWHVPSNEEWTTLATCLAGDSLAGNKLKEKGIAHWKSPNTDATNESGFTALPGGGRALNGSFLARSERGYWWSSSEYLTPGDAWSRNMAFDKSALFKTNDDKLHGLSVRCMKD
jgi:uncharacterized protein (TIGR02145 family)